MCIRDSPPEAPPARPPARLIGRFGICAHSGAERTPPELRGSILRPLRGPRSSSFERLKLFRTFRSCPKRELAGDR
eukprot:14187976-Alexandrium_andersonii.AAC.1